MSVEFTRRDVLAGAAALGVVPRGVHAQTPLVLRAATATIPVGKSGVKLPALNALACGPALHLKRSEPFTVRVENTLAFDLYFRTQGLRGNAVVGNDPPIKPAETREIVITPPDAGTFAYALASEDGLHVLDTLLLSGAIIVSADMPRVADRDVVVALNSLTLASAAAEPLRAVLVNGAPDLKITARSGENIRLRIVNPAQEALAAIKAPDGAHVVAIDGQPCEPFPPLDNMVVLPPLGRADIVVTVADTPLAFQDAFDTSLKLVTITPEGEKMADRYLAKRLPENTRLPKEIRLQSATRVTWKPADAVSDPIASVKAGGGIVLTLENDATTRALMLEGHTARLLDTLDDGWKPWWQDVFMVEAKTTVRIAFAAQETGRYALDLVPLEGNGAPTRAFIEVT